MASIVHETVAADVRAVHGTAAKCQVVKCRLPCSECSARGKVQAPLQKHSSPLQYSSPPPTSTGTQPNRTWVNALPGGNAGMHFQPQRMK